ncbi:DNA topoisomerase I [Pseudohyphozyma bogoriensis]|nr:DNA topoisomerase I [Pseudohyphozyma bogoriensis]
MAPEKVYKKRVIQADSDESEDDVPLAKKPKQDDATPAESTDATPSAPAAPALAAAPAPADAPAPVVEPTQVKIDIYSNGLDSDSDDDDKPLAAVVKNGTGGDKKRPAPKDESESESEDEKPLVKSKAVKNAKASSSAKKAVKKEDSDDAESEDDDEDEYSEDDAPKKKSKAKAKAKPASKEKKPASSAKDKKPVVEKKDKKPVVKKVKTEENGSTPVKKGKGKAAKEASATPGAADDDEEEVYKWWENEDDGVTKWKTLEHNGVLFPDEYVPHGVKMKYDGKLVDLPPESEEVATFFAAMIETDHAKNPVFVKNFFQSWTDLMKTYPPRDKTKITKFELCDFSPIAAYCEAEREKKKSLTAAEKKVNKAKRDEIEAPFKTCLLDGRKENVGNFRVEPPGLFRGRGEHPKTGLLKTRVRPEQITINIGKDAKVPTPPPGHKWKDVVHDDKVTWLATWKENINGAVKYVFLAAGSSLKGQSDYKKFEKARALKDHVDRIRKDYTDDLKNKEMATRQRATAVYLIDRFALRNGNEKGEDEADTVGCCSLRFEHVTLEPPTWVTFDFLGKDSIRYTNRVSVDEQVFKNLKIFKKEPKAIGDLLFDRLSTSAVNKYLTSYMEGLTAKVFRTYNASWTFTEQLKDTPTDVSVADKILAYNRANRLVAILCNHQRSVSKGHSAAMEKLNDKTRALKYQRRKLRSALAAMGSRQRKEHADIMDEESDLEDEWIDAHEEQLVVLERQKITKKFEKENVKREEDTEASEKDRKPLGEDELKKRLKDADAFEKELKVARKNGWKDTKLSEEKLVAAIKKMDERIEVQKLAVTDRDEGKEISLGTSKINYLDPRITVAWAKKNDVPLNKLLSKTLLTKFTWALEADGDFEW